MECIRRNAKTVAIRAVSKGNHRLLRELLNHKLIEPSTQVTVRTGNQIGTCSLVCSNISPSRLQAEICRCGLDSVLCRNYLQRATLLELAASFGQSGCCQVLLEAGADIYGASSGATPIVHILHQLKHVAPPQTKYTETLKFLLRSTDPQVYIDRWRKSKENATGYGLFMADFLYPVNMACALHLPVALELLLNAGFPLVTDQKTTSCYKVDSFVLLIERTTQPNASSVKCLNLLLKHSSAPHLKFTPEYKMLLLNTAVRKQQVQHLQILLDVFLDPTILCKKTFACLLTNALRQNYGRNNCREMAKLLVNANCCDYFIKSLKGNGNSEESIDSVQPSYPTPLSLAIVQYSTLVPILLECGIPIWGQMRKVKSDQISAWIKDAKFRKLYKVLKDAEYSDFTLAKEHLDSGTLRTFLAYADVERQHTSSLFFQCRKTIRTNILNCNTENAKKLGLPKSLTDYILLN